MMNNSANHNKHEPIKRISWFRFYEELNDFLPKSSRKNTVACEFTGTPSVKNIIETIGIPHSEVDLIVIEGVSVGFDFLLKGGEKVAVYPVFESLDISPIVKLRPKPLRTIRFIVDVNLGKLARKLRLLGFDTLFRNNLADDEIVDISLQEKRIILTRDKGILKHSVVKHGYWVRNAIPKNQLHEVVDRLQLQNIFNPFSRCSTCNSGLKAVNKEEVIDKVPNDTFTMCNDFWQCTGCGQFYWKGTHYRKICTLIEDIRSVNSNSGEL